MTYQPYYQKVNSEFKKMQLRGIRGKGNIVVHPDTGNFNNPDYAVDFTGTGITDVFGHGSLTGSIIKSSIGLAPYCELHSVKCFINSGSFDRSAFIQCLQYARSVGAHWISLSLTTGGYDQGIQDEINLCDAAGIVMIASPGNSTTLTNILYPAGGLNVIAANSVDYLGVAFHKNGLVGSLSHGIDICCNGLNSECLSNTGALTNNSGTSLSSPWFTGAACLVRESLGYPTPKETMDYILRKAIKQTDPVLYGRGLFTF